MSQNIQVKACIVYEDPFDVVVVVFVLERATKLHKVLLRRGHGLIRQTGALLM